MAWSPASPTPPWTFSVVASAGELNTEKDRDKRKRRRSNISWSLQNEWGASSKRQYIISTSVPTESRWYYSSIRVKDEIKGFLSMNASKNGVRLHFRCTTKVFIYPISCWWSKSVRCNPLWKRCTNVMPPHTDYTLHHTHRLHATLQREQKHTETDALTVSCFKCLIK